MHSQSRPSASKPSASRSSASRPSNSNDSDIVRTNDDSLASSSPGAEKEASRHSDHPLGEIRGDTPTLDIQALEETRAWTGADETFLAELITTYLDDASQQMLLMRQAQQVKSTTALGDIAHSLRPASSTMGAARLASLFQKLEDWVKRIEHQGSDRDHSAWAHISQLIEAIILEQQAVAIALRSYKP